MPIEWNNVREYTDIIYQHDAGGEGIAKITINRPEKRNAFRPETVNLLGGNTFGPALGHATNCRFRLRILYGRTDHRTNDGLRRRNRLQMPILPTGTFRALLLHADMPNLSGSTGAAMIDVSIHDQPATNTTP